jgi:hypothetical protein
MYITVSGQLEYTVTIMLKKNSENISHNRHLNMSPHSSVDGKGTLSSVTSLVSSASRLSLQWSSVLIKSQQLSPTATKSSKLHLKVQALLQYLYDMLFSKK